MNRAQRRALKRPRLGPMPPLCPSGQHAIQEVTGTYRGEKVATAAVCTRCRRTSTQILEQSPADRALFETWSAAQAAGG